MGVGGAGREQYSDRLTILFIYLFCLFFFFNEIWPMETRLALISQRFACFCLSLPSAWIRVGDTMLSFLPTTPHSPPTFKENCRSSVEVVFSSLLVDKL